jgi:hypothetical protein
LLIWRWTQVGNKSDAIKIACDFISIQSLAQTHQLVSELREHRLAAKWGEDVLALYDTLYHAYSAFPALQETADLQQRSAQNAETLYHSPNLPPTSPPNPSLDDCAMIIDDSSIAVDDPSMAVDDSTVTAMTVGDSATTIGDPPPSKRQRKLHLRHINEKQRRRDAMQEARRTEPNGDFKFLCPLCPEVSYFDRSGLLGHL